ncbi:MAG TPA: putative quinol monooxygenase [Chitinophagaceae bacterium]
MRKRKLILLPLAFVAVMFIILCCDNSSTQNKNQMVRLAKLVIDSAQLESYNALLKEEIEASVRLEPGVLTLYAVAEKNNPTHITILEIYTDTVAYKLHLQTPHFIKYKDGTKDMVKSLELVETVPLVPGMKIK